MRRRLDILALGTLALSCLFLGCQVGPKELPPVNTDVDAPVKVNLLGKDTKVDSEQDTTQTGGEGSTQSNVAITTGDTSWLGIVGMVIVAGAVIAGIVYVARQDMKKREYYRGLMGTARTVQGWAKDHDDFRQYVKAYQPTRIPKGASREIKKAGLSVGRE